MSAYRTAAEPPELWAHGLALALRGRCPFCAEVTSSPGILAGRPCDVCGGTFGHDRAFGARVVDEMRALTRERFGTIVGTAVLASLLAGPFPFFGLLAQIVALVLFRVLVVSPCLALMGGRRRFVVRWTLRLATACFFAFAGLLVAIPCASFLHTGLVLGVVWWGGRAYLLAQLARERDGLPVSALDWVALGGVVAAMLMGVAAFLLLIASIWSLYTSLFSWVGCG